jgi:hypothetical protein
MPEFEAVCNECDEEYEADSEEAAIGWMFGHTLRTEHTDMEKHGL